MKNRHINVPFYLTSNVLKEENIQSLAIFFSKVTRRQYNVLFRNLSINEIYDDFIN